MIAMACAQYSKNVENLLWPRMEKNVSFFEKVVQKDQGSIISFIQWMIVDLVIIKRSL